jgi:hypothetical protein
MATYIQGLTDYIPQIQTFRPDLNYYSNVLQTKQSQYDSNYKQLSGLYGTLLNSPLTRDENIERRNTFFNTIEQDVKKISGLDLSREENIGVASKIFDPILKDQYIAKDMAWTKNFQGQVPRAENLRTCTDPDKCGGQYWDTGMKALQYQQEEFKLAGADESLQMSNPRYTAFQNLSKEAIKAAKDSGFNITIDHKEGGYIVTDTNGNMLLNSPGQGKGGILPTFLASIFKDDQKFKDVFNTQAYVTRKDFSKINAPRYGSESAAESAYITSVINQIAPQILKQTENAKAAYDEAEARLNILNDKVIQQGLVKNSPEQAAQQSLLQLLESKPAVDDYHQKLTSSIEALSNVKDINQLRQMADNIVSDNQFMGILQQAAEDYALGTQKRSIKADPFEMSKYEHDLSLRNSMATLEKEYSIWERKEKYQIAQQNAMFAKLGVNPEEVMGMTPAEIKEYIKEKGGIAENTSGAIPAFGWQAGKAITNTYDENNRNVNTVVLNMNKGTSEYLKQTAEAMRASYQSLKGSTDPKSKDKMTLIENNMQAMFDGTGFNGMDFLSGSKNTSEIDLIAPQKRVNAYGKAYKIVDDPTSYYWAEGYKQYAAKTKGDIDKNIQIFNQANAIIKQGGIDTKNSLLGEIDLQRGNLDPSFTKPGIYDALDIQKGIINSIIDNDGHLVDRKSAKMDFFRKNYRKGKADEELMINTIKDFDTQYDKIAEEFKTNYKGKNLTGQAGSNFEGGSGAVAFAQQRYVNPSAPNSDNTKFANSVVGTIMQNMNTSNIVVFSGDQKTPIGLDNDPEKAIFAANFLSKYQEDLGQKDKEGKASFTLSAQATPESKMPTGLGLADPFDWLGNNYKTFAGGNLYKISPSPTALKDMLGKDYDPQKDYSFTTWVKGDVDNSEFAQSNKLTTSQGMSNIPGFSLNYNDPNLGKFNIRTDNNGKKWVSMEAKKYDPATNSWGTEMVPEQPAQTTDVDELWRLNQEALMQYSNINKQLIKQTLNK